ncbi:glycosyltransferase family 4 protein [Stigmatella erecta]|uniref:Glycosyltransferase involved in cell wall bisynthesis n=1 Tax=Stigmatella erecta TaxID=83460 RepID=A0A1I0KN06_9BACT|nr:glycosyltransferase family 4 protein [Stigmatella erecta]SEU26773.1 Glycosyltransferase involved in cell wall bisynthesis [Stigmatella erecta]
MRPYTLIAGDFVATGGMDRANLALASHLARRGHPVRLVAHRVSDELRALPNVRFIPVPKPAGAYLLGEPLLDAAGRLWALRTLAEGGEVVANGGNCTVPAVNWIHYVHGAYAAEATGTPLRQLKARVSQHYYRYTERRAVRRARLVIANSQRTRDDILQATGIPAGRVHVVYLGSDPERFQPASPEARQAARAALGWAGPRRIALFVGALGDRRKGFDSLLAAWERLCAHELWDVDLKVVGEGPQRAHWEREVQARGLGGRIQFLGFRKDVPTLLSAADLLVAPTRYEPYGLGVQEALCAGLAVLVSRRAGVAERYPDALQELLLDDPDDVAELVRRLESWRAREALLAPHVAALSGTLRAWTWERMAVELVDLLERGRAP